MKKVLLYVGIIICLLGLVPLVEYLFDYNKLSDYGKGFIWGKGLMILIGICLVVIGRKGKQSGNKT